MKRTIAIVLLLIMLLSVTACRQQAPTDTTDTPTTVPVQAETTATQETVAPAEDATEAAVETEATIEKPELEKTPVAGNSNEEEKPEVTKPAETEPQETKPAETEPKLDENEGSLDIGG